MFMLKKGPKLLGPSGDLLGFLGPYLGPLGFLGICLGPLGICLGPLGICWGLWGSKQKSETFNLALMVMWLAVAKWKSKLKDLRRTPHSAKQAALA